MKLWKVLNLSDTSAFPHALDELNSVADVVTLPTNQKNLMENIGDCDAYFSSLYVRLDAMAIARADKLRVVVTPTTGLDHIDIGELEKRGIDLICIKAIVRTVFPHTFERGHKLSVKLNASQTLCEAAFNSSECIR